MKIWCLFSVENNYDQPDYNLVTWWAEKPSIERLAAFMRRPLGNNNDDTVAVVKLWSGERVRFETGGASYRLEEVEGSK